MQHSNQEDQALFQQICAQGVCLGDIFWRLRLLSCVQDQVSWRLTLRMFCAYIKTRPESFKALCLQIESAPTQQVLRTVYLVLEDILGLEWLKQELLQSSLFLALVLLKRSQADMPVVKTALQWARGIIKSQGGVHTYLKMDILMTFLNLFDRNICRSQALDTLGLYFSAQAQFDQQEFSQAVQIVFEKYPPIDYSLQRTWLQVTSPSSAILQVFDETLLNILKFIRVGVCRITDQLFRMTLLDRIQQMCLAKVTACYSECLELVEELFDATPQLLSKHSQLPFQLLQSCLLSDSEARLSQTLYFLYRLQPEVISRQLVDAVRSLLLQSAQCKIDVLLAKARRLTSVAVFISLQESCSIQYDFYVLRISLLLLNLSQLQSRQTLEQFAIQLLVSRPQVLKNPQNTKYLRKLIENNLPTVCTYSDLEIQLPLDTWSFILKHAHQIDNREQRALVYQKAIKKLDLCSYNQYKDYCLVNSVGVKLRGAGWHVDYDLMAQLYQTYQAHQQGLHIQQLTRLVNDLQELRF